MRFADDQASSSVTLESGITLTKCDSCRLMYAERNARGVEGDPPCETCRVDLLPANEEAAEVYMIARGQVITRGMDGVVTDISIPAVKVVMDMLEIRDQWTCLMKVRRLFFTLLEDRNGG